MFNQLKSIFGGKEENLPLLKFVSGLYPDIDLSNVVLIACQHLLGTTYNLFEELFKKGLKPENVFLIGKCYSTNEKVYQKFVDRKVHISESSKAFDSTISFDEQFQGYIEVFLQKVKGTINTKDFKKIIILDDGGGLLLFANDFFKDCSNFVGIEQTSSGYERLKDVNLLFPVFNIARSKAKLEYESPMVAELIVNKIEDYIKESHINNPKILVVGQGYIGKGITQLLNQKYSVNGCDRIADKCDFGGNYKSRLGEFDVIVGAAGVSVLAAGDFGKLKKGVVLISASSSDREFSAVYLRRLEGKTDNCHKDFDVNDIELLNGGFPINFDGREHSLSPEKIQLTRALLLAGIYESLNANGRNGILELDNAVQQQIIKKFSDIIK